jgi:carbon storage regulator CsrA
MLVLSRQSGERIVIDPRQCPVNEQGLIEIELVRVKGDRVTLGITAPVKVLVLRGELHDAHQQRGGDAA